MPILKSSKVIYYHQCNDVFDFDGVEWTNPNLWGLTGTFEAGLINNAYRNGDIGVGGVYSNNNGSDRVTVCFWTFDQLVPARVNVGFINRVPEQYQLIQLSSLDDAVRLFTGDNTCDVSWSGVVVQGSGWHFHVLDVEHDGSDWTLRHSRDGAPWTVESPQAGPAFHDLHSDAHIAAGNFDNPTNKVDEVVLWRDVELFTTQELSNLYELFNTYETTMDQYTDTFGITNSMKLWIYSPDPDLYNNTQLYISGPPEVSGLYAGIGLYIEVRGPDNSPVLTGKPFDWLLQTSDYYPRIIGTLLGASSVTIQVWEVTDGQNIFMTVPNSGCYAIGNTDRWGWSTSGLPSTQGYAKHYFYMMTSDTENTFDGQFIMDVPERARWIHPTDRDDYIVS